MKNLLKYEFYYTFDKCNYFTQLEYSIKLYLVDSKE